jgi:hypothetical protein
MDIDGCWRSSPPFATEDSTPHEDEDAPAEVLALVGHVFERSGGELSSHLGCELVIRVLVEEAADAEPLRRGVAVLVVG